MTGGGGGQDSGGRATIPREEQSGASLREEQSEDRGEGQDSEDG